ncbi:MAG TPA: hypothetical protein VFW68_13635 [Rhodocyclaceae bacterium]|nr:hypothetical protein [Rhodocyclaceae bacterium]
MATPSCLENGRLLGLACIGGQPKDWCKDFPVQTIAAPVLGGGDQFLGDVWLGAAASSTCEAFGTRFRHDGNVLYGVIEVAESGFEAKGDASPLQVATEDVYRRIFQLLDQEGYPHLWRVWNYLAAINADDQGLERYRQFNIGRQAAFVGSDRPAEGNVPAACALGVSEGPLTIAFLAARTAPVPLENPRQVSAYLYPAEYGPRSPVFSRAALAYLPGQELFFVSGTASIVGHQTLHLGDVVAQTRETFANIEILLGEAEKVSRTSPYRLSELSYRAYVRHAADFPLAAQTVAEVVGPDANVVYVQADVCRADLLVEIEAMASHRIAPR